MSRMVCATFVAGLAMLAVACGDKGYGPSPSGAGGGGGAQSDIDGGGGADGGASGPVSYTATIAPMMTASCSMSFCHGGSNPSFGIALDSYAEVKANAAAANASIQNGTMPIGPGAALSAVDKKNFQDWVNAGAPNN